MGNAQKYSQSTYEAGGRGPHVYDCWGLARHVLHHDFGLPLFPEYGEIHPQNKSLWTGAGAELFQRFEHSGLEVGAIACGYIGIKIIHVGVVVESDHQLKILHAMNEGLGIRIDAPDVFSRLAGSRVDYRRFVS